MANLQIDPLKEIETTCGSLLGELQMIWDNVGEPEASRNKMLLELKQECLDLYRRKVDQANRNRAQIRQTIADSEAELAAICSVLGELPVHIRQPDQKTASLMDELNIILPELEEMRKRRNDRQNQFAELNGRIQKLSAEIYGTEEEDSSKAVVEENDLSLRKLEEMQKQLESLQSEKSGRLKLVMDQLSALSSFCSVLGLDFEETVKELHPSLVCSQETHSISTDTMQQLEFAVKRLRELKLQRMQRLQDLAGMLLELWNLMDTPVEEQQPYQNVTCNIAASEDEIAQPNMLSEDFIKYVEAEVFRLEELKSSKVKELVIRKKAELEEICRRTHLVPKAEGEIEHFIEAIESGALDPAALLEQIEMEIGKVKEEAFSRKEILEKVEKWLSAREEEEWLEEYNMDEKRYSAGHLTLKRAEKARTIVNKLPGMVETLTGKVLTWESEREVDFLYDGINLLSMLEEYNTMRQQKDQERKRHREQKRLQGQLNAEQEAAFGSKPSPLKTLKKSSKMSSGGGNKRASVGGNMHQTPRPSSSHAARATPNSRSFKKDDNEGLSTAKRALDKNFTFNGRESVPSATRRPFSPITATGSSRAIGDYFDEENIHQDDVLQQQARYKHEKIVTSNTPLTSDDENNIVVGKRMQKSSTAGTPSQSPLDSDSQEDESDDEMDYSFEERRAGFVPPDAQLKKAIQV